jgi:hypothetical protein
MRREDASAFKNGQVQFIHNALRLLIPLLHAWQLDRRS